MAARRPFNTDGRQDDRRRRRVAESYTVLLLGNPGVGKSTIQNILSHGSHFASGVHIGTGMTTMMTSQRHEDVQYIDTPGLSDVRNRQRAAAEITKALRRAGHQTRVVFVITLEAGRVRPDDVVSIKLMLDAMPRVGSSYGVVVNKVTPAERRRVEQNGGFDALKRGVNELMLPGQETKEIFLHSRDDMLDGDDDNTKDFASKHEAFEQLRSFVSGLPLCNIDPEHVKDVSAEGFFEIQQNYEAQKRIAQEAQEQARRSQEELARRNGEHRVPSAWWLGVLAAAACGVLFPAPTACAAVGVAAGCMVYTYRQGHYQPVTESVGGWWPLRHLP